MIKYIIITIIIIIIVILIIIIISSTISSTMPYTLHSLQVLMCLEHNQLCVNCMYFA